MNKPTLVVMAAGMGSRYGGLKQIDPIDEYGNLILDYSIFDAVRAGFQKVIFVIKEEMKPVFQSVIWPRIDSSIKIEYVFQTPENCFKKSAAYPGRIKPLGTGHAVLCCQDKIQEPFAVINADDYYGPNAFFQMAEYLSQIDPYSSTYSMVGYPLKNTLTENGSVARGICTIASNGKLQKITECPHIIKINETPCYSENNGVSWIKLSGEETVSMNFWGFTPSFFKELTSLFQHFLTHVLPNAPLTEEFFLPDAVNCLIQQNKASVKVIHSKDQWYGVTYAKDKKKMQDAFLSFQKDGRYPIPLWKQKTSCKK